MNKDEILAKARKEVSPILGDEREQQIETRSYQFAYQAFNGCFVLLYLVTWMLGDACVEMYYPVLFMNAARISYRAWKLRKKIDIIGAIFLDLCIIALTYALIYSMYTDYLLGRR